MYYAASLESFTKGEKKDYNNLNRPQAIKNWDFTEFLSLKNFINNDRQTFQASHCDKEKTEISRPLEAFASPNIASRESSGYFSF